MDEATWGALTLVLTLLGGAWTWFAFRHRGAASGLRGAALTLVPPAAFLTGTTEMFTEIGGSVADWATHLVLSPVVWLGIALAGVSVVLFGVSGAIRQRQGTRDPRRRTEAAPDASGELPPAPERGGPVLDDDMADIEAILRRRGIT